jgi:hypothetical protein
MKSKKKSRLPSRNLLDEEELKKKDASDENKGSFFIRPWFVISVVVACFAILTPKIFLPLFNQIFGFTSNNNNVIEDSFAPNMRRNQQMPPPTDQTTQKSNQYSRPGPNFGRGNGPAAGFSQQMQTGSSSSKSLLNFLLPIYAIGIGIYMVYTIVKVFNKDKPKSDDNNIENDSDFDEIETSKIKFRESHLQKDFKWDPKEGKFKMPSFYSKTTTLTGSSITPKTTKVLCCSEESEDELNNYERYKGLDPDYVAFIKQKRKLARKKRNEQKSKITEEEEEEEEEGDEEERVEDCNNIHEIEEEDEEDVPLTPNNGITSITNTNVLMNETLERMKHSLNKINTQLIHVEKKGDPLNDPELEILRLQLSQTEQQMARIMTIVGNVSDTIQTEQKKIHSSIPQTNEPRLRNRNSKKVSLSSSSSSSSSLSSMSLSDKENSMSENDQMESEVSSDNDQSLSSDDDQNLKNKTTDFSRKDLLKLKKLAKRMKVTLRPVATEFYQKSLNTKSNDIDDNDIANGQPKQNQNKKEN